MARKDENGIKHNKKSNMKNNIKQNIYSQKSLRLKLSILEKSKLKKSKPET